ncbi:DedA family protein [Parasalinivibrio latis]|uniref:DedA family protein n=1 Tax=Parasalinivibrio latis TaxID=2952610 RepID=UPI0030E08D64
MPDWLPEISSNPWQMALLIILISYLLEDVAIAFAAVAASEGAVSLPVALAATFVGIASGDLGLYGLGYLARYSRLLRYRLFRNRYFKTIKHRFSKHIIANVFLIRFVPGLRAVGFSLSGFFHIGLIKFSVGVGLATALWTLVVFTGVYNLGSSEWLYNSHFKWLLVPAVALMLYLVNRLSVKRLDTKYTLKNTDKGKRDAIVDR